jgi:hypothetical protein
MSALGRPPWPGTSVQRSTGGIGDSPTAGRRSALIPSEAALSEAARQLGMSEQDILDLAIARSAWLSTVEVRLGAGHIRLNWSKQLLPALTDPAELWHASAVGGVDLERILHDDPAPTTLERADGDW